MNRFSTFLVLPLVFCFMASMGYAQTAGHKVIVPAYIFPYDNADPGQHNVGPHWSMLIEAAKVYKDRLIVIANVNNGPGNRGNSWAVQKYTEAILKVRQAGGIVLGYVHLCYGLNHQSATCNGRTLRNIEEDIANWHLDYNVDGYFFDEAPTAQGKLSWLQALDQSARSSVSNDFDVLWRKADGTLQTNPNRKLHLVMHYGTMPAATYFSAPQDWIHSVCEGPIELYPSGVSTRPNLAGTLQAVSYNRQQMQGKPAAAMLYQKPGLTAEQRGMRLAARLDHQLMERRNYSNLQFTWDDAKADLLQSGFSYIYLTNDGTDGNPWDSLPAFLMRLF